MPKGRDRLHRIASEFRRGLLDGRPSALMCYAVSAPLHGYLSACGYETELIEGEVYGRQHFWLRLADGRILDATADQFDAPDGGPMPEVYIGDAPAWYWEKAFELEG